MLRFVEDESRYNAFLEPITLHSRTASVGVADALDLKLMECFQGPRICFRSIRRELTHILR